MYNLEITRPFVQFVRDHFKTSGEINLHEPYFDKCDQELVLETVKSGFVSSSGNFVSNFEEKLSKYTGSPSAVATVNGTAALHSALIVSGVSSGDLVITQPVSFIATCNAISYCGAEPIFIDVDRDDLGLSPEKLDDWLQEFSEISDDGICRLRSNRRVIRACLPVHTFGHPAKIDKIKAICLKWRLMLIEDAAEALGSFYKDRHLGTFGHAGAISFNGNKIITTGGGGAVLTKKNNGKKIKHLTTTAKKYSLLNLDHDSIGYNYRLPNLNAALGCGQIEKIEKLVKTKRTLADRYFKLFKGTGVKFFSEPKNSRSNYWLNAVILEDKKHRNLFIQDSINARINTRPLWTLISSLPMYSHCVKGNLENSTWLEERLVNIPSSAIA